MIWIVLAIIFYLTSGIFFVGFQLHFSKDFYREWSKFDKVLWCIAWLPIILIILVLMACSEIREWLHG